MTRLHPARALLPLLALLLLPLAACSDDPPHYSYDAAAEAAQGIDRALRARERAVRSGTEDDFLRTVVADPAFEEQQTTYFENLRQLPVGTFRYHLDRDSLERDGDSGAYWAEVDLTLRLDGYDSAPVTTRDRLLFSPGRAGHYRLSATTDHDWERAHLTGTQPWDLEKVDVREDPGVLGIFDDQTVSDATTVLAAVESALSDDTEVVPVGTVPGVVVYATSDPSFLTELTERSALPGGDPAQVDALTVPVAADMGDPDSRIASYRVLLSEDVLDQDPESFGRLVRHELTHVLLGARGHGAPLWLTEGIAEYVSVQPMPTSDRQLPAGAIDLARQGLDELPVDEVFSGPDARSWYAVAWWICEYVARDYGPSMLFRLLDAMSGGTDPTEVLRRVLGLTSAELAQRGAALMVSTYG